MTTLERPTPGGNMYWFFLNQKTKSYSCSDKETCDVVVVVVNGIGALNEEIIESSSMLWVYWIMSRFCRKDTTIASPKRADSEPRDESFPVMAMLLLLENATVRSVVGARYNTT